MKFFINLLRFSFILILFSCDDEKSDIDCPENRSHSFVLYYTPNYLSYIDKNLDGNLLTFQSGYNLFVYDILNDSLHRYIDEFKDYYFLSSNFSPNKNNELAVSTLKKIQAREFYFFLI